MGYVPLRVTYAETSTTCCGFGDGLRNGGFWDGGRRSGGAFGEALRTGLDLAPVAFGAGFDLRNFAVGAALGAAGHGAGGGEAEVGLADPKGRRRVAAALVEGCEPLVWVDADEAFGDALLVEGYGAPGVAALLRALGSLVASHGRLEVLQRVPVRPDPLPLLRVESVERPGRFRGPRLAAEDCAQAPQHQRNAPLFVGTRSIAAGAVSLTFPTCRKRLRPLSPGPARRRAASRGGPGQRVRGPARIAPRRCRPRGACRTDSRAPSTPRLLSRAPRGALATMAISPRGRFCSRGYHCGVAGPLGWVRLRSR